MITKSNVMKKINELISIRLIALNFIIVGSLGLLTACDMHSPLNANDDDEIPQAVAVEEADEDVPDAFVVGGDMSQAVAAKRQFFEGKYSPQKAEKHFKQYLNKSLVKAVYKQDPKQVRDLIKLGADPNTKNRWERQYYMWPYPKAM